jgi:hypothetical protein
MPLISQGYGSTVYLTSNSQITGFTRAGERTWMAGIPTALLLWGVPGLTTKSRYLSGDNIKPARGDLNEWERDITVGYFGHSGALKEVGVTWTNGALRDSAATDADENRIYLSYSLPILTSPSTSALSGSAFGHAASSKVQK